MPAYFDLTYCFVSKGRESKEIKNQPIYVNLKSNLTPDIDMGVVLALESGKCI